MGGLVLVFLGLSSTFAWAPINVDTRYLLPLFAPVGLLAARGCLSILELRFPRREWALGIVLVAVGVTLSATLPGTWHRLAERNRASVEVREAAQRVTAGSKSDAVFLAYLWNDQINFFGERATLFYRRINARDRAEFEDTLNGVVAELLGNNTPVYYAEDRQPPAADSLLQAFDLSLWKETPIPVYRVDFKQ